MEQVELRTALIGHLDKLKRNRAAVPLEVLKTKYRKPYEQLCRDIAGTATLYVKSITLGDLRLLKQFFHEAVPLIQAAIDESGLLKQISHAAFRRQDIEEIDRLAKELKGQIETALQPFYDRHLCLYATAACFQEPPQTPELYNEATGCIYRDQTWIPLEKKENAYLIFITNQNKNAKKGETLHGETNPMAG